jgi:succinyl-CoA synthetase beta subunit
VNIYEYQAKALLREAGLPVPEGRTAATVAEAMSGADSLGCPVVVKAQIHAGGRGKAGGIQTAGNAVEAGRAAAAILGMRLRTAQTGEEGRGVSMVLVEQAVAVADEFYLSVLPDRESAGLMIIASRAGGVDIEEVAAVSPDSIIRVPVDPLLGAQPHHLRQAAFGLGLTGDLFNELTDLLARLCRLATEKDLLLVEINPLAVTAGGRLAVLDAKIEVDDNGLFRHPELAGLYDPAAEDPLEAEARKYSLNYIRLDGTVGNMVNGAGLAMATMDLIKQAGAEPANFLDVGGGANAEMIENGLRIILSDKRVRAVLINIFGGILRCDVLAAGIVEAARKTGLPVPVVVRMEGTNVDEGRAILAGSGLELISAADLTGAAEQIAQLAGRT